MVSVSLHWRQQASGAKPELQALFCVHMVLLSICHTVSFVFEGRRECEELCKHGERWPLVGGWSHHADGSSMMGTLVSLCAVYVATISWRFGWGSCPDKREKRLGRRVWVKKPNFKFYLDILTHLKILELKEIQIVLPVHFYLRLQVDNFYTVHCPDHRKFRCVWWFLR